MFDGALKVDETVNIGIRVIGYKPTGPPSRKMC